MFSFTYISQRLHEFTYISQKLHEFTYISQSLHEIVLWQAYMAKVWQAAFCGEYPRNLVDNQFFIHLKSGVFFSPDLMRIINYSPRSSNSPLIG